LIEDVQPDVIGLVEVSRRWLDALAPPVTGYPGRLERGSPPDAIGCRGRDGGLQRVVVAVPPHACARSCLCDSRAGAGVGASFPAASAILRIPIDHLLASCEIGVRERRVERDVGSDHLPVVLDLLIPPMTP